MWADEQWFYINLNESFLGVSFEAQTHAGQTEGVASPAQVRAAAMLTEMLRSRYQIPGRQLRDACAGFRESLQHAGGLSHRLGGWVSVS